MDEPEGEPTDERKGGSMDEPAVKPMDESKGRLAQGHPPTDEFSEEHLPNGEPMEIVTVECPTLGQDSPPGSIQEEDRVVIHTSADKMDHCC